MMSDSVGGCVDNNLFNMAACCVMALVVVQTTICSTWCMLSDSVGGCTDNKLFNMAIY